MLESMVAGVRVGCVIRGRDGWASAQLVGCKRAGVHVLCAWWQLLRGHVKNALGRTLPLDQMRLQWWRMARGTSLATSIAICAQRLCVEIGTCRARHAVHGYTV